MLSALLAMPAAARAQQGTPQVTAQAKGGKVIPLIGGNAIVTITPSSDNVMVSGGTTHTYQFSLGNSGTRSTTASLTVPTCTGAVSNCSVSPRSVSLPANGAGAVATVTYTTASVGTGTIILNANWPSGNNVQGTLTVTMPSAAPAVSVSPNPNYSAENFATNDPNFSVKNNGNTASTYTLSASCSGNISACSVSSPSASVSPGASTGAIVYYTTGPWTSGNGTATLTATSPYGEVNSTSVTVVPLSSAVTVSPHSGATSAGVGASTNASFTVSDVGNASPMTYALSCGYSGVVTSCSVAPSVQIYVGSPQSVSVSYTTSGNLAGGTGGVTLTATATGPQVHTYTDQGSYNVTVADARTYTPVVTVSPNPNYSAESFATNDPNFVVRNSGNTASTYNLSVTCSGNISACSVATPTTSVSPGSTVGAIVYYTTGPWTGGNGTATLTATSPHGDVSSTSVTVVPLSSAVTVGPKGSAPSPEPGVGANTSVPFTVTNAGNSSPTTYNLSCAYTGVVTSCSAPATVAVSAGTPQTVSVAYRTSSNTAGDVSRVQLKFR